MFKVIAAVALLLIMSLTSFSPAAAAEPFTVTLAELNGSGQSGTVTFNRVGAQTEVVVNIKGDNQAAVPAHIDFAQCSSVGPAVYWLADVANGQSTTTLNASLEQLTAGGLSVTVHFLPKGAFAAPAGSCADIPMQ